MLVQEPGTVGVLIHVQELKSCLQLPPDLFLQGMGKLYTVVTFSQVGHESRLSGD